MTDWSNPTPLSGPVPVGGGHVPFTYRFNGEELAYLQDHGFEPSVVSPGTRWTKRIRNSGAYPALAVLNVTPHGLVLACTPSAVDGARYREYTGLTLIPMLVRASLAGEL